MKKLLLLLSASVLVMNANAQTPQKKNVAVIGKITANWCPPCGAWGWDLNSLLLSTHASNAVGLNIYSSTRTDGGNQHFQNQAAYDMASKITLNGYPSFSVNLLDLSKQNTNPNNTINTTGIKADAADSITKFAAATVIASTGMTYSIVGNTVTVKTKTKFWEAASGTYKVAVYLVEDGAIAPQASKTGNVAHHNVLRSSMSASTWGEQIATGTIAQGDEFDKTFTFDLSSSITPNYADQPSTWDKTILVPFAVIYKVNGGSHEYVNGARHYDFETSISNIASVNNLAIFPNPATTQATVSFDSDKATEATILVTDAVGKVVHNSGAINVTAGRYFYNIETSNIGSGLYNVTIKTQDGVLTQKLSVAK